MPGIVNVGLSRKLSKDYQSRGFTLNIQAELPANAVEDPNSMAEATGHLFQLAEDLLTDQVNAASIGGEGTERPRPQAQDTPPQPRPTPRPSRGPSAPSQNGDGGNGRGIAQAQLRAIRNMAKRAGQDPAQMAEADFGVGLRELSIRQASSMIDDLKAMIEEQAGKPVGSR